MFWPHIWYDCFSFINRNFTVVFLNNVIIPGVLFDQKWLPFIIIKIANNAYMNRKQKYRPVCVKNIFFIHSWMLLAFCFPATAIPKKKMTFWIIFFFGIKHGWLTPYHLRTCSENILNICKEIMVPDSFFAMILILILLHLKNWTGKSIKYTVYFFWFSFLNPCFTRKDYHFIREKIGLKGITVMKVLDFFLLKLLIISYSEQQMTLM